MVLGLFFGALLAAIAWWALHAISGNLPALQASVLPGAGAGVALLVGLVAGSAMLRRRTTSPTQLGLFSGVAGGFAGGVSGFVAVAAITAAYLTAYASWPSSWIQDVLLVLSIPVFGAVGFCAGALIGAALGLLFGGFLRIGRVAKQ